MKLKTIKSVLRCMRDPSSSLVQVRCSLQNYGDIMLNESIENIFKGSSIMTLSDGKNVRRFDSIVGLSRIFKYCFLGGGTLIFTDYRSGWLPSIEFFKTKTIPLFTFGTGVFDPEFTKHLSKIKDHTSALNLENTIDRWIKCLQEFKFVSLRGIQSKNILEQFGLEKCDVIGDPALFFSRDELLMKDANKKIGINISKYSHFWNNSQDSTVTEMTTLLKKLYINGWKITFFPAMYEDFILSEEIIKSNCLYDAIVFNDYLNIHNTLSEIEKQDLFVGVKLHTVVSAFCVYTPAIMIGYQPKCYDFMKTMDAEDYHFRSDMIKENDLYNKILEMYDDRDRLRKKQFEICKIFKTKLFSYRDMILRSME